VINTNLLLAPFPRYSLRYAQMAIFGYPLLRLIPPPPMEGFRHHIIVGAISLKTRSFGLHFCLRKFGNIFNHFYAVRPECYRFRWNNAK